MLFRAVLISRVGGVVLIRLGRKRSTWTLREAASVAVGVILVLLLPVFLAILVFVGPVSLVAESVELITLSTKGTATIQSVEVASGRRGTSRVAAQFLFEANGSEYHGSRVSVGFSDWGYSTGRAALARELSAGSTHAVYFNTTAPQNAVLLFGWNNRTLVANGMLYLMCLVAIARYESRAGDFSRELARTTFIAMFVLMIFAPPVVSPLRVGLGLAVTVIAAIVADRFLPPRWRSRWPQRQRVLVLGKKARSARRDSH